MDLPRADAKDTVSLGKPRARCLLFSVSLLLCGQDAMKLPVEYL